MTSWTGLDAGGERQAVDGLEQRPQHRGRDDSGGDAYEHGHPGDNEQLVEHERPRGREPGAERPDGVVLLGDLCDDP